MMRLKTFLAFLMAGALLAGCSLVAPPAVVPGGGVQTVEPPDKAITPTVLSRPEETRAAPGGETAPATATQVPSATPAPSATPSPTPTLPPNPMSIVLMRQRAYPGSPITIEQTLNPGANYERYYASYLSDGLKIYGLLTVPRGNKPAGGWPAIVFNHGYIPPSVYKTTERYVAYVDALARNGYVVFKIDYRGHDRSEGEARGGYGDPGYTVDALNALSSLKQFPDVDPARIGMWGHSMGGFVTLRSMVISPDIKVGVIWAGVVVSYPDLMTRWRRGGTPTPTPFATAVNRWRNTWIETYGTPEENPEFWASISANSYLADLSGPLQLHASPTDEEVPFSFSQTLYDETVAAGKEVEFYQYPDDNHNLSVHFTTAMTRTIEFFDKYLKGP